MTLSKVLSLLTVQFSFRIFCSNFAHQHHWRATFSSTFETFKTLESLTKEHSLTLWLRQQPHSSCFSLLDTKWHRWIMGGELWRWKNKINLYGVFNYSEFSTSFQKQPEMALSFDNNSIKSKDWFHLLILKNIYS